MSCLNIPCFHLDKQEMKFEINEIFDLHLNNWLHLLTQYHIFCHLHLLITDMYQACTHPIAAYR